MVMTIAFAADCTIQIIKQTIPYSKGLEKLGDYKFDEHEMCVYDWEKQNAKCSRAGQRNNETPWKSEF